MDRPYFLNIFLCSLLCSIVINQSLKAQNPPKTRWNLFGDLGVSWNVSSDSNLPHNDNVEMSGKRVSAIITYGATKNRVLTLSREVIWPMLRIKADDPRGYLRRTYEEDIMPEILIGGKPVKPGELKAVEFTGVLTLKQKAKHGVEITRELFPSTDKTLLLERWKIKNGGTKTQTIAIKPFAKEERDTGMYGEYLIKAFVDKPRTLELKSGASGNFTLIFSARKIAEALPEINSANERNARLAFLNRINASLVLQTPDPVINRAFALAKIRTSESLFETKRGLLHSPGGGRYYGGTWANDQVEYAGPFFPYLGYEPANRASLNTYRIFAAAMKPDYSFIPYSFEVEGDLPYKRDRGDAAMYAYGASRFALALADKKVAKALWPAIQWSLEYCLRQTNAQGVVESETDEMEGRLPTGKANLSTSTLTYGALRNAANLARALNRKTEADEFDKRANNLSKALENYFGAEIGGFKTYRYFAGNDTLRGWIGLPLTMGIFERKEATLNALFSKLWTDDGLRTQANLDQFWDRQTLYAFRGTFIAGDTERGMKFLKAYTSRRLLGEHVPYPVEAFPEGGQAHLAAESALYCRIFTEGILGLNPTSFKTFSCAPKIPSGWKFISLHSVTLVGKTLDINLKIAEGAQELTVKEKGKIVYRNKKPSNEPFVVNL